MNRFSQALLLAFFRNKKFGTGVFFSVNNLFKTKSPKTRGLGPQNRYKLIITRHTPILRTTPPGLKAGIIRQFNTFTPAKKLI
jgi:hypothetical protein